jgi:putative toxin-antitoxin system antitoxin component (TIGR02293 family)|tara:strand:- start:994 stop:1440 length:447 start_codon:yes stop_codon:yes gene_type:complete
MPVLKPYHPEPLIPASYWSQLGIPCQGVELIEQVREGFVFETLGRLAVVTGFSTQELAEMIGLSHYALRLGRRRGYLSTQHSDRLFRVARVIGAAFDLFDGDRVSANQWLMTRQFGLGGHRPVDMLATYVGYEAVLTLVGRLEYGVLV